MQERVVWCPEGDDHAHQFVTRVVGAPKPWLQLQPQDGILCTAAPEDALNALHFIAGLHKVLQRANHR